MFVLLIVLGAMLFAVGYALPDQYPPASDRRGAAERHSNAMEDIARSFF